MSSLAMCGIEMLFRPPLHVLEEKDMGSKVSSSYPSN
jgi:hypothetical protein